MKTSWRELNVWSEGEIAGSLGDIVENCPANLDSAVIAEGRIAEWQDYFLSAEGEEPDWDTPRGEVSWEGFAESLAAYSS